MFFFFLIITLGLLDLNDEHVSFWSIKLILRYVKFNNKTQATGIHSLNTIPTAPSKRWGPQTFLRARRRVWDAEPTAGVATLAIQWHSMVKRTIQLAAKWSYYEWMSTLHKPHVPWSTFMDPVLRSPDYGSPVKNRTSFINQILEYQTMGKVPWDGTKKNQIISNLKELNSWLPTASNQLWLTNGEGVCAGRKPEFREWLEG